MFHFSSLKLFRKVLILSVMLIGIFVLTSTRKTEASICCSVCDENYWICVDACYSPNPGKWNQCIQEECVPVQHQCLMHCNPLC